MRFWQLTCFAAVFAASPLCVAVFAKMPTDQANLAGEEGVTEQSPSFFILAAATAMFSRRFSVLLQKEEAVVGDANEKQARLEQEDFSLRERSDGAASAGLDPYAQLPLDEKPAEIILDSLRDIPIGTPAEGIKRVADAFGLDAGFMEAVAKIESDFDAKQRTSYIGLFQLSRSEFRNMGLEILLTSAITLLRRLTN
jgi:hypothetical protein